MGTMSAKPDQKHRNTYKRFWRNMRNYQRTIDQMQQLDHQAARQLNAALDAFNQLENGRMI